jgi:DNA-binding transcriptional LysR family regulator
VSLQILELESRYGLQLVERLCKHAHATAPGRALAEHARRIAEECGAADTAMRRFRDGWLGQVRVGTTLTAMMHELPPILKRLRADHPGSWTTTPRYNFHPPQTDVPETIPTHALRPGSPSRATALWSG